MAKQKFSRTNEVIEQLEVDRPLSKEQKRDLMCALIRSEAVFLQTQDILSTKVIKEYFPSAWQIPYSQVYGLARKYFKKFNKLPGEATLRSRLTDAVSANEYLLNDGEIAAAERLIGIAFSKKYHRTEHFELAIEYTRRFAKEATKKKFIKQIKDESDDVGVAPILAEALEALQRADSITDADTSGKIFGANWDIKAAVPLRPTGCSALDDLMSGGDKEGEVNLFMGPYASCKTLLCVQCTCAGVDSAIAAMTRDELEGRHPITIMVSYEVEKEEFELRCLCYMAKIPFGRMNGLGSISELAGPGTPLQKYEKKVFREQIAAGQPPASEQERMAIAMRKAEAHIRFIDFSGGEGSGAGGVDEIVARIERIKQHDKNPFIWSVWVDHLDAMVDNMMNEGNLKVDQKRHVLKSTPLYLRRKIAAKYRTRVWLMHQLSAETNSRHPAAKVHHTDGAECRAVAQYCAQAIVTGNKDDTDRCVWRITKKRRVKPKQSEVVMQIDGNYSRVINLGDQYVVDYDARQIVPKSKNAKKEESTGGKKRRRILLNDDEETEDASDTEAQG
jgi:hypothetical protein